MRRDAAGGTRDADLTEADCTDADLREANLRRVRATRTSFTRADLRWSDLRGADLQDARLDDALLNGAVASGTTTWPAGFTPDGTVISIQADPTAIPFDCPATASAWTFQRCVQKPTERLDLE